MLSHSVYYNYILINENYEIYVGLSIDLSSCKEINKKNYLITCEILKRNCVDHYGKHGLYYVINDNRLDYDINKTTLQRMNMSTDYGMYVRITKYKKLLYNYVPTEINNQKIKELENENNLIKKKLEDLEHKNNALELKVKQFTLATHIINCDKSISDIVNLNLWHEKNLNISVTNLSINKSYNDIIAFLLEYRPNKIEILSNFSNKFKKFTANFKAIIHNVSNYDTSDKEIINKWINCYSSSEYNDYSVTKSEFITCIINYMYYFGFLVVCNSNDTELFTFLSLSEYNNKYVIYYSDYLTINNDTDIIASSNIKEQIVNNKNNIVIKVNEKNITYFKKIQTELKN